MWLPPFGFKAGPALGTLPPEGEQSVVYGWDWDMGHPSGSWEFKSVASPGVGDS